MEVFKMLRENTIYNGIELKQVNKTVARKLYNNSKTINLVPCNANIYSQWVELIDISISDEETSTFDSKVNNFEYYACNNELGSYTHFLVEVSEVQKMKNYNQSNQQKQEKQELCNYNYEVYECHENEKSKRQQRRKNKSKYNH